MRIPFLVAALLALAGPLFLHAADVIIVSPDSAQTYAYSSIIWRSLRWDGRLKADITFSNQNYASCDEPRDDESFTFEFPKVALDAKSGTFFARSICGKHVPVARLKKQMFCETIRPAPGTMFYVLKKSGRVKVALIATNKQQFCWHWFERNEGWSLDNLLRSLCRTACR